MSPSFEIRVDDLRGPEIAGLLREHLSSVAEHSPPESIHALGLAGLRAPDVTFWSVWDGAALAGCGALKELSRDHGELKSMRTALAHLRKGVAAALLEHMLAVAERRCYRRVSLETGSQDGFAPARALYSRFGFEPCGPFADYGEDRNSVFMTREVAGSRGPAVAQTLVMVVDAADALDGRVVLSPGVVEEVAKTIVGAPVLLVHPDGAQAADVVAGFEMPTPNSTGRYPIHLTNLTTGGQVPVSTHVWTTAPRSS